MVLFSSYDSVPLKFKKKNAQVKNSLDNTFKFVQTYIYPSGKPISRLQLTTIPVRKKEASNG
jgi:hypothetical protein